MQVDDGGDAVSKMNGRKGKEGKGEYRWADSESNAK